MRNAYQTPLRQLDVLMRAHRWRAGDSIIDTFLTKLNESTTKADALSPDDAEEKPDPRMLTGAELWEMYRIIDPTVRRLSSSHVPQRASRASRPRDIHLEGRERGTALRQLVASESTAWPRHT